MAEEQGVDIASVAESGETASSTVKKTSREVFVLHPMILWEILRGGGS